jgi:hypothetical protein
VSWAVWPAQIWLILARFSSLFLVIGQVLARATQVDFGFSFCGFKRRKEAERRNPERPAGLSRECCRGVLRLISGYPNEGK